MNPKLVHVCTVPITLKLFMRGQIDYVKTSGFEIAAVAAPGSELQEVAARDGIEVYAIPFARRPAPFRDALSLLRLFLLFLRVNPTIVHSSTSKAGPLAMVAAFLARVPVRIYTLRGVMTDRRNGPMKAVLGALEWMACHCAHRVISVSPSVSQSVVSSGLCPPHKIKVLARGSSNGVDAENRFNPELVGERRIVELRRNLNLDAATKVVGFIGRLVAGKGIADLASAWQRIRTERKDVVLLIVGHSEEQAPVLPRIMQEFKADPRVIMTDFVKNEELPAYYGLIDVIAFPTESEGFPNVPLEAASMEVPVVATSVTGCVDAIVDGVTGTLVTSGDAERLAQAVLLYLADSKLCSSHGRAARERVLKDFRPEVIWRSLLEEYVQLLEGKGIRSSEVN
ncbi:MAG: glycosyltransferase [Desulfomonile tiedjei]|uniref:Glycosyltransferase n=1 Tax=Desulfomonile tiedjei TaxID=2358 RepID=A0A9D6V687_9BACT|nr:glycosyltransferase [Desulfomonile tiedjei]